MKRMHSDNARYLQVAFNKSKTTQLGIKLRAKLADGSIVSAKNCDFRLFYYGAKSFKDGKMVFDGRIGNAPITTTHGVIFDQDVSTATELLVDAPINFYIEIAAGKNPSFEIKNVDPDGKEYYDLARDKTKRVMIVDSKNGQFVCLGAYDENDDAAGLQQPIIVDEPRGNIKDAEEQILQWYLDNGTLYFDEDDQDDYIRLPKTINGQPTWYVHSTNHNQIMVSDFIYPPVITHKPHYELYIIPADVVSFPAQ